MPPKTLIRTLLPLVALVALAAPCRSQYLYLDSNGDGVHTSADVLPLSGTTTVGIWLQTDANRDGSTATCIDPASPITIYGYEVDLHVSGGAVAWSSFHDLTGLPNAGARFDSTNCVAAASSGSYPLPAGLHQIATIAIRTTRGIPWIDAVQTPSLPGAGGTQFYSDCPGQYGDNFLRLGVDWSDADGLGPASSAVHPPTMDAISAMSLDEGSVATQDLHATDPDLGAPIWFYATSMPAFMTLETTDSSPIDAKGRITLAPNHVSAGDYTTRVGVTDGGLASEQSLAISVADVVVPLSFPPLPDVTLKQHEIAFVQLLASDPNGFPLSYRLDASPSFVTLVTGDPAQGYLYVAPQLSADVGTALVVVTAFTATLSRSDTLAVTVLPNPLPPSITIQRGDFVREVEGTVLVDVRDPDHDAIASLTFDRSLLPAADQTLFTPGPTNESATLTWTPTRSGPATLRFTAVDATGLSTTRDEPVLVGSPPPIVTAPPVVKATPLVETSFTVSALSPDGVTVPVLTLDPTVATSYGATFDVDPLSGVGTFRWTPPLEGVPIERCQTYTLPFRATDGIVTEEAETRFEVSLTDVDTLRTESYELLVSNAGQVGFDPQELTQGLVYPAGSTTRLLDGLGPWIAGKIGPNLVVARGGGDTEFGPGTIASGGAAPYTPRFKNYRLTKGDVTSADYLTWPTIDGAPVTGAGSPRLEGKTLLWSVANDAAAGPRADAREYADPTSPFPVELRQTVFAFGGPGPLSRMAFIRYSFTNRGTAPVESTYVAVWANPDIGNPNDDLAGYDRDLETGYVYNSSIYDSRFGLSPPAVGVAWLRGPTSDGGRLPCGAFQTYTTVDRSSDPITPTRSFLYMQGKDYAGGTLHVGNDKDALPTTYRFDGDPVSGTGWLDDWGLDKRIVLSAGPFTLPPGATAEYEVALLIGQGTNQVASITDMRFLAGLARSLAAAGYVAKPFVDAPAEVTIDNAQPFALVLHALDPDGDPLASLTADLSAFPAGSGARFDVDPGLTGGTLSWTPYLDHAQSFTVRFTASNDQSATFATILHVRGPNRAPVANAGGPYAGVRGTPVVFSSANSFDPDGDYLVTTWSFGDDRIAVGPHPSHIYTSVGMFTVVATVSDGFDTATDKTTATIRETGSARAWESGGAEVLRLAAPRESWCFQVEPIDGSFPLASIAGPIRLVWSGGNGAVEIDEIAGSAPPAPEDRDRDGVPERHVCFAAADFRTLFADLPPGEQYRELSLQGTLAGGATFTALLPLRVVVPEALRAVVAPNPMNPGGTLTVRTERAGRARITLHDVRGRTLRTLHDGFLAAGLHDFAIDGRNADGVRLASGIYFYSIVSDEGANRGRFTILK